MASPPFQIETLTVDNRSVRLRAARPDCPPERLPLVLLHGLGCSGHVWEPVLHCLAECAEQRNVFAPDLPGYGHSPGPPETLGMPELAAWTTRLLDALGIERAHLAGNSMGCQVALALARHAPKRVGSLILLGPTVGDAVSGLRYGLGLLRDGVHEPLRYNLLLAYIYAQMGLPRYFATVKKMMADEPLTYAAEILAPCLVMRGECDGIISEDIVHQLAAALPSARAATIPHSAHAAQFHRPDAFTRLVLDFLREVEPISGISPVLL